MVTLLNAAFISRDVTPVTLGHLSMCFASVGANELKHSGRETKVICEELIACLRFKAGGRRRL